MRQARSYGFHFVIFQVTNPDADAPGYMAHASVLDISAGQREQDVRFGIGAQAQPETGFELGVVDWTLQRRRRHTLICSVDEQLCV